LLTENQRNFASTVESRLVGWQPLKNINHLLIAKLTQPLTLTSERAIETMRGLSFAIHVFCN